MIINFAARMQAAFGVSTVNVSSRLDAQGFGDVVKDESGFDLAVYTLDKNSTFDEVLLYRDGGEGYLFAYKSISDDYTGVFATPPMLSFKRAKKLVITPIDNSDIEVVERYGTEPYEISWRGLLIDMENHDFPLEKMKQINQIFEVNGTWNIAGHILEKLGIEAVYIRDIAIDFVEGFEDTVSYQFTMRAIKPLEYQLAGK